MQTFQVFLASLVLQYQVTYGDLSLLFIAAMF